MVNNDVIINNPKLSDNIGRLKYIGPLFRDRFRRQQINTLADLKNLIESQSKAQNTRFLRNILENPRKQECVGVGKYDRTSRSYRKYCVRNTNQLGWYSVITYLTRKGVSPRLLPNRVENRTRAEKCKRSSMCSARGPVELLPVRYERLPYYTIEFVVLTMMNTNSTNFTGESIWNLTRRKIPLRNISATLSKNTGNLGKKLFQQTGENRETGRTQYKLKSSVKRTLAGKIPQQILDYLRKL